MATKHKYRCTETRWTYGAELELVDWPNREPLPVRGMAIDETELHNVNSNGVAVDGTGKLYNLGGEILTVPSTSVSGPAEQYRVIKVRWPEAAVNYRMGLNVHVRVPGLREDLGRLLCIQEFCSRVMPSLLPVVDPIPAPQGAGISKGELDNCRKRKRDQHTLIPDWRLALQRRAKTPREFFEAEVLHAESGRLCWAIVPRNCVNLRQLLQTDTVEFRHFFMPVSAEELLNATLWCKTFLEAALDGEGVTPASLLEDFNFAEKGRTWPAPMTYDPWLDRGWHYTSRHHNDPADVPARICEWLETGNTSLP